jgi:hypothetical protein
MVTENKKIGLVTANFLSTMLEYVSQDVGVADCLFKAFTDNAHLLYTDLTSYISAFVQLIGEQGKDRSTPYGHPTALPLIIFSYLAFLASICSCQGEAVRPNQDAIIDILLEQHPQLLVKTQVFFIPKNFLIFKSFNLKKKQFKLK